MFKLPDWKPQQEEEDKGKDVEAQFEKNNQKNWKVLSNHLLGPYQPKFIETIIRFYTEFSKLRILIKIWRIKDIFLLFLF